MGYLIFSFLFNNIILAAYGPLALSLRFHPSGLTAFIIQGTFQILLLTGVLYGLCLAVTGGKAGAVTRLIGQIMHWMHSRPKMAVALISVGFALDALVSRFIASRFYDFFSSFKAVQQYGLYLSNFYSVYSVLWPVSVAVIILWLNRKQVGLVV